MAGEELSNKQRKIFLWNLMIHKWKNAIGYSVQDACSHPAQMTVQDDCMLRDSMRCPSFGLNAILSAPSSVHADEANKLLLLERKQRNL